MSFICSQEQMGWCDCHVNNVFQSIIWGTVVITAGEMSHGRRLKVSHDLPWITHSPRKSVETGWHASLRFKIFLHCLQLTGDQERRYYRCWHLSARFDRCPICLVFLLEVQFQFHFVCWQISSAQTWQQRISCKVVSLNHTGRKVQTLSACFHKIEENCQLSRQTETLEEDLSSSV